MSRTLSRDQIRRIDQLAVERYGIPSILLMENAGRGAAEIIDERYGPEGRAVIFCGTGNNGGDGCVIARHLHNAGWRVDLVTIGAEARMSPDTRTNFRIVQAMHIGVISATTEPAQDHAVGIIFPATVVIDALLGTGFSGQVRSDMARLIELINEAPKRATVAVDVPSGLDCETGKPSDAVIRADRTVTFVARKRGFDAPAARPYVGVVDVAQIGAPRELIDEIAAS